MQACAFSHCSRSCLALSISISTAELIADVMRVQWHYHGVQVNRRLADQSLYRVRGLYIDTDCGASCIHKWAYLCYGI